MSIPRLVLTSIGVVATVVGLVLGLAVLSSHPMGQPALPQSPATSDLTVENLLREVNEERAKAGVRPLEIDPLLNKSAQLKADEIERSGVFGHVSSEGKHGYEYIRETGIQGCGNIGESLAADTTAQGTINDWLGSPPHKAGMLNPKAKSTGFGISDGPGYSYIVEHFCTD